MDLRFSDEDEAFRRETATWLEDELSGDFANVRGRGGPGDDSALIQERKAWERRMGEAGWIGLGWPADLGGRGLSLTQQVIFYEEYARAGGPGRVNHVGEMLLAPTLIAFGTEAQKQRFLPPILKGEEIWCQGYSEPDAGSDLANVQTKARREGEEWIIDGQKVWTSWAEWADWCFAVCRTDPDSERHKGLSYLLVPMQQSGVEMRPILQMTGDAEFFETFFDGARTAADNIVGAPGEGWKVALATLSFERGASTLGQQMNFRQELDAIVAVARENGRIGDPLIRQRLADAWIGLEIQRYNALRTLSDSGEAANQAAMVTKLHWANWHRSLGKLAMDVLGPEAEIADEFPYGLNRLQRMYLFTRSDTIYGGSNQIQRNIIGERALGLPREPR
ncbi:MAG: acyl-CoA dehydrogenase family protein [Myxococcota bacterium]|nr:acyl-CoA dehydrogenase [Deltaproteobacteria bacterium]MCP4240131.1 acyl-CoA dehydrogenase [bacterium]MDP6076152.1 acyl-CoA dehydrogenase family protein [Myxococcota bacterium]MDP6243091.1 acyl-CoA dehydrogenase family protein [Myxococcota bacterium]MDP7073500.1 acyl-CoA dehydrogenase family protein [Myxococcota bacterium]